MDILIATPMEQTQRRLADIVRDLGTTRCAATWPEVLDAINESCAMALIDAALLDQELVARIRQLHNLRPSTRIARLCNSSNDALQIETLAAGAFGSIRLSQSDDTILRAVNLISNGEAWIERHLVPMLIQRLSLLGGETKAAAEPPDSDNGDREISGLTCREKDVLNLLSAGESNKLIARHLNITDRTVKAHLTSIYKKLGVTDRVHLILYLQDRAKA